MFPISTQTGDDRRDRNLSSPHRHRYRHHPKFNVGKGFGLLVTIGDDPPQAYAGKHKKECISSRIYAKACDPSSPIVTKTRLTLENKWFSVVTMAVTMQKRGVYRHPYRHRHGFCNTTPQAEIGERLGVSQRQVSDDVRENSQLGKISNDLGEHWNDKGVDLELAEASG